MPTRRAALSLLLLTVLFASATSRRYGRDADSQETRADSPHLTRKAMHQSYDSIILDLTADRSPEAIVEFTEIMNNEELSRDERNERLHEWGDRNNCDEAVSLFKIKEELTEEEDKKEKTRKVDMLSSVAYQMREAMMDKEMSDFEKNELIRTLAETAPERIQPLLLTLFPSLQQEQLSSDEIIGVQGQNDIDKVHDTNEILIDISYYREELSLRKRKEEVERFLSVAEEKNARVGAVLRLLWPKPPRRRRHIKARRHVQSYDEEERHKRPKTQHRLRRPTKIPPIYSKDF